MTGKCHQKRVCSLLLQLGDGFLGVRAQAVGQHQQAQQGEPIHSRLQLLLAQPCQAFFAEAPKGPSTQCQQAQALASEVINHLQGACSYVFA